MRTTCPAALQSCDGECVDLSSDPANCGSCGAVCSSGSCANGVCTTADTDDEQTGGTITLPNTGSGSNSAGSGGDWTPAALIAGAAALGTMAIGRRQHESRRDRPVTHAAD